MKRKLFIFLCLGLMAMTLGCTPVQKPSDDQDAPLQIDGTTSPPPGCVDLRERGGAC